MQVVPWPFPLLWHARAIFLLTAGAIGIHRSSLGSVRQTWLGWLGVALVVAGQLFSLETTMLGFFIYGAAIVMTPRRTRWGGALLVVGAVGFLAATALNGPFWGDPSPRPAIIPGIVFGVSLLLIASAGSFSACCTVRRARARRDLCGTIGAGFGSARHPALAGRDRVHRHEPFRAVEQITEGGARDLVAQRAHPVDALRVAEP